MQDASQQPCGCAIILLHVLLAVLLDTQAPAITGAAGQPINASHLM